MPQWLSKLGSVIVTGVKAAAKWAKSIPSESDGTGSTSRIALLTLTFVIAGLLVAYYRYHHLLPDHDTLYGLAALLTAVVGGYGINKWKDNDNGSDGPKG